MIELLFVVVAGLLVGVGIYIGCHYKACERDEK